MNQTRKQNSSPEVAQNPINAETEYKDGTLATEFEAQTDDLRKTVSSTLFQQLAVAAGTAAAQTPVWRCTPPVIAAICALGGPMN